MYIIVLSPQVPYLNPKSDSEVSNPKIVSELANPISNRMTKLVLITCGHAMRDLKIPGERSFAVDNSGHWNFQIW